MTYKRWLVGMIWILAAPTVVVLAFALATTFFNARAQSGALQVSVEPQVVWPWDEAEVRYTVADAADGKRLPPIDLVLMVDISGSMWDSLPTMKDAAFAMAQAMPRGPDASRFALVRFDTEAEMVVPWTADPDELGRGLDRLMPAFTGQNDTRAAFERLKEILGKARSDASKVVVWYSDGHLDVCPPIICSQTMSYDEIVSAAGDLHRSLGVEHYAVAPPGFFSMPHEVLQLMTGPGRVLQPGKDSELASAFERIAAKALKRGEGVSRIEQRLDARHFEPLRSSFHWRPVGEDGLALETTPFPGRSSSSSLDLDPKSMGLWDVGIEPASLTLPAAAGKAATVERAIRRPKLLVLTWWTLFWLVAPALLWGLLHWPKPAQRKEIAKMTLPAIGSPTLPGRLPPLPAAAAPTRKFVPTLFLGIGGQGRKALEAVRGELDLVGAEAAKHQFLAADLDRRASAPEAVPSSMAAVETHLAPPVVTELGSYLPAPGAVPAIWRFFDAARYYDAARDQLDLAGGARGDRALGRLALFRWLSEGRLLAVLRGALEKLVAQDAAGDLRQVVVLASAEGGFGSGTFSDWGRLVKRLGRDLQRQGRLGSLPEVVGVLVEEEGQRRPGHRLALELELQSAQAAGACPQFLAYGSAAELQNLDSEPAYHALFEARGATAAEAEDQAAQLAALLAEVPTHIPLVNQAYSSSERGDGFAAVVGARVRAVQIFSALERERRRLDLLARLCGPDVLLDLQSLGAGRVEPPSFSDQALAERLESWARKELRSTPLALFLGACSGRSQDLTALASAAPAWPAEVGEWLHEALRASLERELHGRPFGGVWRRGWMPGEAAAVLRFMVRRLLTLPASDPSLLRAGRELARAAEGAARALEAWLEKAARAAVELSEKQRAADHRQRCLSALAGRCAVPRQEEGSEEATRKDLAGWLGEIDTISALRKHLFPVLVRQADGWAVQVRDCLEEAKVHPDWSSVEARLARVAAAIAESRSDERLGQALLRLNPQQRRSLQSALVELGERPDRILLVLPRAEGEGPEAREIAAFCREIPQPADHGGRRLELESCDGDSIRRLSLLFAALPEDSSNLLLAGLPETEAEALRSRLERQHRRRFPRFPVALRIALAQPAAFAQFARFFRNGRLVHRRDEAGREQWYLLDQARFLTFGQRSGLADAAAAFSGTFPADQRGPTLEVGRAEADFSRFFTWLEGAEAADADVLTLAAIDIMTRET